MDPATAAAFAEFRRMGKGTVNMQKEEVSTKEE